MNRITNLIILLAFLTIISGACSTKNAIKSPTAEELILFPAPPDTARIQFLTFINTSADIIEPISGFKKFFVGEEKPNGIGRPFGITSRKEKIYICDPGIGGLEIIDLDKRSFEYFLPTGKGQLRQPLNCFVDKQNYLFVADGSRRQIVVFDSSGKYIHAFGEAENYKPIDVYVNADKVYVTNLPGNSFHVYNRTNFELLNTFPEVSKGDDGFLSMPTSVYCLNDQVFITDFGEGKIMVYDTTGKFIRSIGSYGRGIGQFARPKEICLDKQGNLYVVDAAFENVQIFNNQDQLLTYFGGAGNMNLPVGISIDYENLDFFHPYVYEEFELKFLIFVTNQYPPNKIGVYGFIEEK